MVLHAQVCGRVGRRPINITKRPDHSGRFFSYALQSSKTIPSLPQSIRKSSPLPEHLPRHVSVIPPSSPKYQPKSNPTFTWKQTLSVSYLLHRPHSPAESDILRDANANYRTKNQHAHPSQPRNRNTPQTYAHTERLRLPKK